MSLKRINSHTGLAVSLADAKAHLRVDTADEDALISLYITAATEMAEQLTSRALMLQTYELALDAFPDAFELTRVPVSSIGSVTYVDSLGVQQTLASSAYILDNLSDHGYHYLLPAYGTEWPATRQQVNAVTVTYTAGYPNAAAIPELVRSWVLLQIGSMFENRQSEGQVKTHSLLFADRLLDRYKVWG